jgi:peptidoglycan/xylan/chitin deacetylase (PgdA/CDA1 family)
VLRARIKGELRSIASLLGKFTRSASPPGPRVLCYHGVCPDPVDEWSVSPSQLREQMAVVAGEFVPVTAEAVAAWARGEGSLPDRAVAVTFDDGYADVHDHAAPILAGFGIRGAAFVSPEFSDRAGPVPGVGYEALRPIMGWREVRALRDAGWTIGSHALTHARLSGLAEAEIRGELVASRERLSEGLGHAVTVLAYPYGTPGAVSPRVREMAREAGYDAAFMAVTGAPRRDGDPFAIPRAKVLGSDSPRMFRATLDGELDLWRFAESSH